MKTSSGWIALVLMGGIAACSAKHLTTVGDLGGSGGETTGGSTNGAAGEGDGGSTTSPTCADGVKNGLESDVDCGGACSACEVGQLCSSETDCAPVQSNTAWPA